jgi:ankyrin repeat protein
MDEEVVGEQVILCYIVKDDVDSLRHQISIGLDPNQQFFWILGDLPDILTNSPPLISVAAFYSAVQCFSFLLEMNADIDKLDELDTPLINFAISGGNMEIIEKLNDLHMKFQNTLQIAAEYGHYELFMWLLRNQDLDIHEVDKYHRNFLHIAAAGGNCQLVQFLIVQGLDVNGIDGTGWTPLHFAVEKRRLDVVRVLLANERINVNCKDVIFESSLIMYHAIGNCMPLHHAVHNADLAMVELMLTAPRIDPNCRDAEGRTPIHIAVIKGNKAIVRALRGNRLIDVTIQANDGRTPEECTRDLEIIEIINGGATRYCSVA